MLGWAGHWPPGVGARGVVGEGVRVAFRGLRAGGCLLGPAEM